ncbi:efflux RND transporter periplasmic adaptor subunit [Variovorax sp. HJSM1_2]|uniref:efflux RND transporter periplasmic adaptor subunit n=1 Tax=Variovorax sp. HJSM1_2 TaxID=3366263 RepID=UPI003BCC381A
MKTALSCFNRFNLLAGLLALGLLGLAGCSDKPSGAAPEAAAKPASAPAAGAAPVSVSTVRAQQRDLPVLLTATGTVTPLTSVDVKAQVTSVVVKVLIKEGQFVKAGELMFTLDARTDEANLAKARAQLAKDNAALADARRQLARSQDLFAQKFVSQGAVDTSQAQVDALAATINADQAAIDAAMVSLSYDRITAPHAGRAGQVVVYPGSVVQANVTPLVTITQLSPIGVAYSLPQRNLTDALGALKGGGAAVTAKLADGGGSFQGRLQFVDNLVDASSGSVKAKAVFDNADNKLWPGAFVQVSQTINVLKGAVIVPEAALIQGARGTVLYTLVDGVAVSKPVKVEYAQGLDAAVSGIAAGDVVVVDGKQNVRPGVRLVERAATADKDAQKTPAAANASGADTSKPAAP